MSTIARMRRGDREALGELLSREGAALEALATALGSVDLETLVVALWKASVLPPVEEERGFVLAVALASYAQTLERPSAQVPELEPVELAQQLGRVTFGGDALDRKILERTLEAHPEAQALATRFRQALQAAQAVGIGPSRVQLEQVRARLT